MASAWNTPERSNAAGRLPRLLLAALFALSFALAATFQASHATLTRASTYTHALSDERAYNRLYDEVLRDPALETQVNELLGGIQIPESDMRSVAERIAPPDQLQARTETAIGQMVASLRSGDRLALAVDVTPFVRAAAPIVVQYTVDTVGALPVRRSLTYPIFVAELSALMLGLQRGDIPSYIPSYALAGIDITPILGIILQASGVSSTSDLGRSVTAALGGGDVAAAVRAATAATLLARAAANVEILIGTLQIGPNGEILLAASPSATDRLESALGPLRLLISVSGPGRIIAALVALAALAALAAVDYRSPRRALTWASATVLAGGIVALLAWLLMRTVVVSAVANAAARGQHYPQSFSNLVHDVVSNAAGQANVYFLAPAAVAVALGAAGLVVALVRGQGRPAVGVPFS